ncbi:glycosyltransferase family 9 protein [Synechococcus sp. CCY 9618]|uniref:glycosyltransferase family 9 protein n=1 Tax=Synechococcus sp. CCY 9618 TaxID=2815602 RepID=UPI001C212C6A|nr:lipopolysaccharide heptosyltransferase family protein [Synechococcus sp. CCY 9618]
MRALFLIPGDGVSQLQSFPAVAATAEQLHFQMQVACHPSLAGLWKLLPAVEKVIPFNFDDASLADWANLLGSVREPDFQACINLASGRQVDLMLSMSHIPNRVATGGFSATEKVSVPEGLWPAQALEAYLRPIGVRLEADAFRLSLSKAALDEAVATLPPGDGPMLLLAPAGTPGDWPDAAWQELPGHVGASLSGLRCLQVPPAPPAGLAARAALVAASDVVLASDPVSIELALLCGTPVVALGRSSDSLPSRSGVQGLGSDGHLRDLPSNDVLKALGLG